MRTPVQIPALIALFAVPLSSLGCLPEPELDDALSERAGDYPPLPAEGSELAYAMLRVVNELDFEALDDEVPLDKRAATSIVEYRAGDDELLGTADDPFIASLGDLDALYWMGAASLWRVQNYAITNGYELAALPPAACEPELEDAVADCLRYTESAAVPAQSQLQGQLGWAPFKADLLSSCLEASEAAYPSTDFFVDGGVAGYLDALLGYQGLLCEESSEAICGLGVAGVADRSQPECESFFDVDFTPSAFVADPLDQADWDAAIAALDAGCGEGCDYTLRVYDYQPGMAPTLLGDVMDEVLVSAPLEYGFPWLTREASDALPAMASGAQDLLDEVLADLDLQAESFDVAVAAEEVPCPNCHIFYDSFVLLLRDAGVIIVLDRETFWDS